MQHLLLLHGALGSAEQLKPLQQLLAPSFHIHLLDFAGHGTAPSQEIFGIPVFAEQVRLYCQTHAIEQAAVFGYSMGGYVALYLAAQQPGLLSGIITLGTKMDWQPESAAREAARLDPDKISEKVPAFAARLAALHGEGNWKQLLGHTASMMRSLGEAPLVTPAILLSISIPVWYLLGEKDQMVSESETRLAQEQTPGAKMIILPDTPHPIEQVEMSILAKQIIDSLATIV
jgi:pimeloyl-ACP methyl ester carboxylesterase